MVNGTMAPQFNFSIHLDMPYLIYFKREMKVDDWCTLNTWIQWFKHRANGLPNPWGNKCWLSLSAQQVLTNKIIPLRITWDSMPTLRSSRLSLSNFSGVSLLSILKGDLKIQIRIERFTIITLMFFIQWNIFHT